MRCKTTYLLVIAAGTIIASARAADWYVSTKGRDTAAGTNWATATATIQESIDRAAPGDTILVSNGVYETGGAVPSRSLLTNRIALTKRVTVRSLNGPAVTIIKGAGPVGEDAVRCAYVGSNATLCGFTLTGGTTGIDAPSRDSLGGGVYCESSGVVSNCVITRNRPHLHGGGVSGGTYYNCVIAQNTANFGGGAYAATLVGCTLHGNNAQYGGGSAWYSTLRQCILSNNTAQFGGGSVRDELLLDCTIAGNHAKRDGGGAQGSKLIGCTIRGNSAAGDGGGAQLCALSNCVLRGNIAGIRGGGSYEGQLDDCSLEDNSAGAGGASAYGTLNRCRLIDNHAYDFGGGSFWSTLNNCLVAGNEANLLFGGGTLGGTQNNCTITANIAGRLGGGSFYSELNNCIVCFNTAPEAGNCCSNTASWTCTTPMPPTGQGNITNDPAFADAAQSNYTLTARSPCIDAGNNAFARGTTDLDNTPRIDGRVDMGAFEFHGAKQPPPP